jgi:hypothetical protein
MPSKEDFPKHPTKTKEASHIVSLSIISIGKGSTQPVALEKPIVNIKILRIFPSACKEGSREVKAKHISPLSSKATSNAPS